MAGKPGRSGGANRISAEEHQRRGTFRADRHGYTTPEIPLTAADRQRTLDGLVPEARRIATKLLGQYDGWDSASLITLRNYAASCARLETLQKAGPSAELYREARCNVMLLGALALEKPR
jgi:hypothetical protein